MSNKRENKEKSSKILKCSDDELGQVVGGLENYPKTHIKIGKRQKSKDVSPEQILSGEDINISF